MPTYQHFQEAKKSENLPEKENVGACLTCKYWEQEQRAVSQAELLAKCMQPQILPLGLLVTGSSACNRWALMPNVAPEARAYAEQGE